MPSKLNLACGFADYREGFVNCDANPDVFCEVHCDVAALPFDDNSAELIVAQDILEHIPRARTFAVLAEWGRVLVPGGQLHLRVPNLHVLAGMLLGQKGVRGDHPPVEDLIENIYGGHRWGEDGCYDAHHWGWTPVTMYRDLEKAGYRVLRQDNMPNFYTYAEWT